MKKFNFKSLVVVLLLGSVGMTTVIASTEVASIFLRSTTVQFEGLAVPLTKPLISASLGDTARDASLYVPARELLEHLGYIVEWDSTQDVLNIVSGNSVIPAQRTTGSHEIIGNIIGSTVTSGNTVINLQNRNNQSNVSESGSFSAGNNQTLVLDITSDIVGGSVDLFLFDPSGREQRITIGVADTTRRISLTEGIWKYNGFGIFRSGSISIVGTVE